MTKYDDIVWPFVYELESPVTLHKSRSGDEEITELEFREPTLGDVDGMSIGASVPMAHVWTVGARLTGKRALLLKKLAGDDAAQLCTIVFGFFASCQAGIAAD
jgi:hypothetical protein